MSEERSRRLARESGAATVEYFMILGLVAAMMILVLKLLYPSAGQDIESLINAWGDRLATQIAGEKMTKQNQQAWGID